MEQVILFGAGHEGDKAYKFLKYQGLEGLVVAYCDTMSDSEALHGIPIISFDDAYKMKLMFVITVIDDTMAHKEITALLKENHAKYYSSLLEYEINYLMFDKVKIYRDYCSLFHIDNMESYYNVAESEKALSIFWDKKSIFYKLFSRLSLDNVVELACGRGRHVPQYINKAKRITLVDVLQKNIDFVKKRFAEYENISYYKCNGYDLSMLPDGQYTSLFTYDAMVHFELLDIYSYLRETYRILVSGGFALFHHSNDDSDYKNSFTHSQNDSGRSFMSKNIFAHLAYRVGFDIEEQAVIDWGIPKLDCITLVRKP